MANTRLIRRGKLYSILSLNDKELFWILSGLIRTIKQDQNHDTPQIKIMCEKFLSDYDEILRREWL